ncbi:MAG: hypothetical protein GXY22_09420 [Clostridiaceae bacterium]|nr:hypothetical protein [Clostridiaceae bacterium]
MSQGKYGLNFKAIAIIAFVLAFFNLPTLVVLFLAYAVLLEKDQWLSRQTFQAFYLNIVYIVATTVIGWIFTAFNAFFGLFNWYSVINVFSGIHSVIRFLLNIALFVFALIAILKLAKGNDAQLPVLSDLADRTLGIFQKKEKAQPAYQAPPATPPYQQSYQAPAQAYQTPPAPQPPVVPAVPVQPPVSEPVAPAEPEEPAASQVSEPAPEPVISQPVPGTWVCSCGRENTGNFCVSCGSPKPH